MLLYKLPEFFENHRRCATVDVFLICLTRTARPLKLVPLRLAFGSVKYPIIPEGGKLFSHIFFLFFFFSY